MDIVQNTFALAYVLFISTQLLREFVFRKGAEAKSLELGTHDKGTSIVNIIYLGSFAIVPLILTYFNFGFVEELQSISWAGIVLMVLGMIIHFIAIKTLGQNYTRTLTITKQHRVMTSGIYSKIRHPGYLGSICVGLGFGMASYNWVFLTLTIAFLLIAYSYRIRAEEQMLTKQFGDEYENYKKKSWALVPYIL